MRNPWRVIAFLVLTLAACQGPPTPEAVVTGAFIRGQYAYIGHGSTLKVMDISQPIVPTLVGEVGAEAHLVGPVRVVGDYAYTTDWDYTQAFGIGSAFQVYRLRNPVQPQLAGEFVFPENTFFGDFLVADGYAYIAAPPGLVVLDVRDPARITQVGAVDTGTGLGQRLFKIGPTLHGILGICGSRAVCLSRFTTLDVSDPAQPRLIAAYDPQMRFYSLDFLALTADRQATVSVNTQGENGPVWQLQVWDWRNPAEPFLVRALDTPAPVRLVTGERAASVAYGEPVVSVWQLADRGPLTLVREASAPAGDYLAATEASADRGFLVYTRYGSEAFDNDNIVIMVDLQ